MWINLSAEETTDNLLTNNTFNENTNGWTLSDSNVRRDSNSYSDAGNSPTVRFKGQTSTISQLVNLTGIEQGKEIKSYTIKYNGYGCGNTPNGWCTAGGDDTIVTNITFTDGTTTEISSHTIAVPYEDGWTHHTFTKSINDTFLTDNVAINFELSGVDTGNSNSWLGPITDNYELMVTYQDYVAPVVEPVVVEPIVIIEPIVVEPVVVEPIVVEPIVVKPVIEEIAIIEEIVVEEPMIGGLELSTEITLDLIQDVPTLPSIDSIVAEIPEIQPVAVIDISMPEISIEMPTPTEIPVDMSGTIEVEPIQEIQEIVVEEPPQQPEMVETTDERRKIEPETKSKIEIAETKTDEGSNVRDTSTKPKPKEKGERETKESTADANQSDEPKETTTVATTKTKESSDARTNSTKSKSKTKDNVQANRPTNTAKKNTSRPKTTLDVSTTKPQTIEQLPLPIAYLQIIQDSITIVETISLRQEQIYGGEQEYNLNTSSITIAGLDNNTSRRWHNLQNERKRFKAPKYSRRSKKD